VTYLSDFVSLDDGVVSFRARKGGERCYSLSRLSLDGQGYALYLDGHVDSKTFSEAVADMFPDRVVLVDDGSYPN
jgi:prepilin-type processing-associated H-X9-DG protein